MSAVLALAVVLLASLLIERAPVKPGAGGLAPAALAPRLLTMALLYGLALGIFHRSWLAAVASLVTLAILVVISIRKRRFVGEPLVFSDFALVRLIVRHPKLYYTDVLTRPLPLLGLAALVGAVASWVWLEPPLLSPGAALALLVVELATLAALWWAARRDPFAGWLRARLPAPQVERHLACWGLLLNQAAYALRWRAELDLPFPRGASQPLVESSETGRPADLVMVVQLESFMDPAVRLAQSTPPGLAAARERAILHGRLRVPAHGAYTMRSEFAVLSGLPETELGFRRFDPYLTTAVSGAAAAPTLASRLRRLGYRTLFIHPFRAGFFDRQTAVARLGFQRCLWDTDFSQAERHGPYVSDPALAARLLAEIGKPNPDQPVFIMAVTMENHGPWPPGRLPGGTDARGQYLTHLVSSDRAISILVEGLSDYPGRVLLCLYGDHPPILPCLDAAATPETDYVILGLGQAARAPCPREMPLTADELGRAIITLAVPAASAAAPMA